MWTEHVAPDSLRTCWRVRPSQRSSFVRVFEHRRPIQTVLGANISVPRWVAWSWDGKETHPWPGWQQKWAKRFIMPCAQHDTVIVAKMTVSTRERGETSPRIMCRVWWGGSDVYIDLYSSRGVKKQPLKNWKWYKYSYQSTSLGTAICLSMWGEALSICWPSGCLIRCCTEGKAVLNHLQTLEEQSEADVRVCFPCGQLTWAC